MLIIWKDILVKIISYYELSMYIVFFFYAYNEHLIVYRHDIV